ncbi:MAG: hypothetical protein I3273_02070 [Candidatus Moeniiplasma glomeromycotorum]|nr:hypothetical protein [Candidatus Moeniiplasma glomeromycotorum]MCE8167094.1 hypothetical protein [Candidatus Moeniiplasma glomeromycotorum]MCE8168894.1 hypothetical protein [Candidatus Moeniiplasma glomeromycotorum]
MSCPGPGREQPHFGHPQKNSLDLGLNLGWERTLSEAWANSWVAVFVILILNVLIF